MFQFTHPGKGATTSNQGPRKQYVFQFTHPGKGATRSESSRETHATVSIHAPWEGCDLIGLFRAVKIHRVSIHAPWEGCDIRGCWIFLLIISFNSRTLGRVRL